MEQCKIVFTVTNDLNTDQRMQRICGTLQKAGFEVLLVGRLKKDSVELDSPAFKQRRLTCRFQSGALFYAEYNLRLFRTLLFVKADIISSVDADTLLPCALVAMIRNKKLVFDAHEYFTEVPELNGRTFIKNIWKKVLLFGTAKASVCYTVGPELAELFTRLYKKKFDIIYNMPVLREPAAAIKRNNIVLYQGDLNEGRGLEATIEAIYETGADLWIAGDGLLKQMLVRKVEQLGLNSRVKFLGKLRPEELHKITLQAYLGINLLDDISLSYQYSIANKFFDYVQCSVPVICADFIEYRKLNEMHEVAILCNHKPAEIAAAINRLFNDKIYYQKLVENCKLAAVHWNWQSQEKKLIDLYRSIEQ